MERILWYHGIQNSKFKIRNSLWMALLGGVLLFAACRKENVEEPKSAACDILSFSVDGAAWTIAGTEIARAYPSEPADALSPAITLSPGAKVDPPSGEARNFFATGGVAYTVTAEDGKTTKTYTARATVTVVVTVVASGTTGDCTWTITGPDGNYTLTISGAGATGDYNDTEGYKPAPWEPYAEGLKTVIVEDGITAIGNGNFSACNAVTSATIGNAVETIGNAAFAGCEGLTSVVIPDAVTAIGPYAFFSCGLTSATLGNSVASIGEYAFGWCDDLTAIAIPASLVEIGEQAFADCGLVSVTIPNTVETIGRWAFNRCDKLTSLTLG
ncbi:MAG: leucine-rich repeat protein, partial [Bacteroidales bacterium]|nr:leucine-rich repeat protein [Bacteroidales bacterium]